MKDEKCIFCKSGKTLKIGIILKNHKTNETVISSTSCFIKNKNLIINKDETIPNLTRGIISPLKTKSHLNQKSNSSLSSYQISNIEYLLLRQEKLAHIKGIKYNGIQDIYISFKDNFELTRHEETRLQNFISSTNIKFPEFSARNLQKLYASLFWIEYAIQKQYNEKSKSFLSSVLEQYKKQRSLTQKQADAVYKTLENLNAKIGKKKNKVPNIELNISQRK